MSPLGTEETKCCSHCTDVKYYLEVILHIIFLGRLASQMGGVEHQIPLEITGMYCKVSLIGVLLTTLLTACESIHFLYPLVAFRVAGGSFGRELHPGQISLSQG